MFVVPPLGSLLARLAPHVSQGWESVSRTIRNRRAVSCIAGMDPAQLDDLGLDRDAVRAMRAVPLHRDPMAPLRDDPRWGPRIRHPDRRSSPSHCIVRGDRCFGERARS